MSNTLEFCPNQERTTRSFPSGEPTPPVVAVSGLMSTYWKETAANLEASLESIFAQTIRLAELVLVIDGPVDDEQMAVIERYRGDERVPVMKVVPLSWQRGLADALNAGIEQCSQPYVLRMDSDDVCQPDRLEKQWKVLAADPGIDVLTSWSEEFCSTPNDRRYIKTAPRDHDQLIRAMRWRNVLVHSTLVIRRDLLIKLGGYRARYAFLEDYDLYVRLIVAGARFHVIPEPLIYMRITPDQRRRRGGFSYVVNEVGFRTFCLRVGFLDLARYLLSTSAYTVFRLLPPDAKDTLYRLVREPISARRNA